MGALTSKNLPFELREWDVSYLKSIDPTDSFGSNTRVYIKENNIILIEPDYDISTQNTWITDKGRQFFDSIFDFTNKTKIEKNFIFESFIFEKIIPVLYYFDLFNSKNKNKKSFTLVFENLGLELLSFLAILQFNFSFLKLKKIEKNNSANTMESNFQLNLSCTNKTKLDHSTFCLIVSNNPRYEGYYLNLNLKKRFSKGNFECFIIGSFINLTFFNFFIGSTFKTFLNVIKGNHLICQKLKSKIKPCLIFNTEFFKRTDSDAYLKTLQILQYSNVISSTWNGINILNYNLYDNGMSATLRFHKLMLNDLFSFSSLYFINIGINNSLTLKKLINSRLLNYNMIISKLKTTSFFLVLDQEPLYYDKAQFIKKLFSNNQSKLFEYAYMPTNTFYENENLVLNTNGSFCKTFKLIPAKKNTWYNGEHLKLKSNWQILRKISSILNSELLFASDIKYNFVFSFNSNVLNNFKNYIYFHFYATIALTNFNFFLVKKTRPYINLNFRFKKKLIKVYNSKLNYWLDDFYVGGKDEYSSYSAILNSCSVIIRKESATFF